MAAFFAKDLFVVTALKSVQNVVIRNAENASNLCKYQPRFIANLFNFLHNDTFSEPTLNLHLLILMFHCAACAISSQNAIMIKKR